MDNILRINSITELNRTAGLPAPKHPLIELYEERKIQESVGEKYEGVKITAEMYTIIFKDKIRGSLRYGRTSYDFQHGTMIFISPRQVMEGHAPEFDEDNQSWMLVFHPDLIRKSILERHMSSYSFFSYESNEALHLSVEEQKYITKIAYQIQKEYSLNQDSHSHRLIISNLELLLNNCLRFYDRQFYTRSSFNKDFVSQFEELLTSYFRAKNPIEIGLPTVSYFGNEMNMSPKYLSDLLKKETGSSAKGHINRILVDKAKNALLSSSLPVSQIAYDLGFEHPQSLSRLFKSKTGFTPNEFRSLN